MQPLKQGGQGPPLFIVHGLGGAIEELASLALHMADDRRVYAIQSRGVDGADTPHDRIEDMAIEYVGAIRSIQPHGPYLLAGYSFGGLVALEMAQCLHAAQEPIALLALFDTYRHAQYRPLRAKLSVLLKFSLRRLATLRRASPAALLRYVLRKATDLSSPNSAQAQRKWYIDPDASPALQRVRSHNYDAWCHHQPRRYAEPVMFFRAQTNIAAPANPVWDWGDLLPRLQIQTIPGDHLQLIGEQAPALAAQLSSCLRSAAGTGSRTPAMLRPTPDTH